MNDMVEWLRTQYELKQIRRRENNLFKCIVVLEVVQVALYILIKSGVM